jgi:hypothetical protein
MSADSRDPAPNGERAVKTFTTGIMAAAHE